MSVLRRAKLRTPDGIESIEYPLGVEAENVEVANGENLSQRLARIDEDLEKNEEDIAAVSELAGINKQNIGANEIRIDALERRSASVDKKPYYFNTVADMKAYQGLKEGDMAITLGYYEANDGGGAEYNIVKGNYEVDDGSYHQLENTLFAELVLRKSILPECFGADRKGIKSSSQAFNNLITFLAKNHIYIGVRDDNFATDIFANGKYLITNPIIIPRRMNFSLKGSGIFLSNGCNIIETGDLGDKVTIDGLTFKNETDYAIYINDTNINAPHLSINKCTFSTSANGIYIRARSSMITINECFFYRINGYAINNRICDFLSINNSWFQDPLLTQDKKECYIRSEGGGLFLNDCSFIPYGVTSDYTSGRYWIGMFENQIDGSVDGAGDPYYANRLHSVNTRFSAEAGHHDVIYYDSKSKPLVGVSSAIIIEDSFHILDTAITLKQMPTLIKFTGNNIQTQNQGNKFLKVTNDFNFTELTNMITGFYIENRLRIIFENNSILESEYLSTLPNEFIVFFKTDLDKRQKISATNETINVPTYITRYIGGITQKYLVKVRGNTNPSATNQINESWFLVSFEVVNNGTGWKPVINKILGNETSPEIKVQINNLDNIPLGSGTINPIINFSAINIDYSKISTVLGTPYMVIKTIE